MTDKITIYTAFVSDQDLETIRANECEYNLQSLTTQRFRAVWNELERLRAKVQELESQPRTVTISDRRPDNCRHRLREEGKSYPRSSCTACGKTVASGLGVRCEFDRVAP